MEQPKFLVVDYEISPLGRRRRVSLPTGSLNILCDRKVFITLNAQARLCEFMEQSLYNHMTPMFKQRILSGMYSLIQGFEATREISEAPIEGWYCIEKTLNFDDYVLMENPRPLCDIQRMFQPTNVDTRSHAQRDADYERMRKHKHEELDSAGKWWINK